MTNDRRKSTSSERESSFAAVYHVNCAPKTLDLGGIEIGTHASVGVHTKSPTSIYAPPFCKWLTSISRGGLSATLRCTYATATCVVNRIGLTFRTTFRTPADHPTVAPTFGFRIGSIYVASIEHYANGYVERWHSDKVRNAYKPWIDALRSSEPPICIDGGEVSFQDVAAAKCSIASFLTYFATEKNLALRT